MPNGKRARIVDVGEEISSDDDVLLENIFPLLKKMPGDGLPLDEHLQHSCAGLPCAGVCGDLTRVISSGNLRQ